MIVRQYFPLDSLLYYGIGGSARFLLDATSPEDVQEAVEFARANRIERLVVVGLGSNLLFPDGLFDGAVLRIVSHGGELRIREGAEDGLVEAFAGEELDAVINFGFARGYVGLEWAGGLPGTVGAGVRGNVGAFGGEMRDVLERADVLRIDGGSHDIASLANRDLRFSYRSSLVKESGRMVVLSATFRLQRVDEAALEAARQTYRSHTEYRRRNHPMEYPTCGSVFKNIARKEDVDRVLAVWPDLRDLVEGRWHGKVSMGHLIGRLGLAGRQVGGAQISPKHHNFIVNLGRARFSDVRALIDITQQRCLDTFGFVPDVEVEIVE